MSDMADAAKIAKPSDLAANGKSAVATNIILVFLSISSYNVIELTFIIWTTFKRHTGLYFWSFLIASWGIPLYSGGYLIKYFGPSSLRYVYPVLVGVGWVAMVSGQSMVLWSRLHLVLWNRFRLKCILVMIIVDGIVLHCATIPMIFGNASPNPMPWQKPYSIMEKIQVTIFFIQELIISAFYITETLKLMKLEQSVGSRRGTRRLMNHLIFVNAFIIVLDVTILGFEYADQYSYQTSYKAFVYSTKLKLEFAILKRLVEMTTGKGDSTSDVTRSRTGNRTNPGIELGMFVSHGGGDKPRGHFASEAYAMGGEEGASGANGGGRETSHARADNGVGMTTEIIVQREKRGEQDIDSIDRKSLTSSTIDGGKARDGEDLSKASSEVHLATRGF